VSAPRICSRRRNSFDTLQQCLADAIERLPDRPGRPLDALGDGLNGLLQGITEVEKLALGGREFLQAVSQRRLAVLVRAHPLFGDCSQFVDQFLVEYVPVAAAPLEMREHLVTRYLAGPRPEIGARHEVAGLAPQEQVRLLEHVFDGTGLHDQAADQAAQPGLVAGQLTHKGLGIAWCVHVHAPSGMARTPEGR
jgi:hypothetical protein